MRFGVEDADGLSRVETARREPPQPMGQSSRRRNAGHRRMLPGEQPRPVPQALVADRFSRNCDNENSRAIHHHHVAGIGDADTHRFGRRIDGAGNDRGANSKARRVRRHLRHLSHNVGRPVQVRHQADIDDAGCQLVAPAELVRQIEGRGVAGRIVIDGEGTGQAMDDEGGRVQHLVRPGIDLRPVAFEPQDLGARGLRRQRVAALREDRVLTDQRVEIGDLLRGAGIDTIEHGIHQRCAIAIHRQHAGANGAAADGGNGFGIDARLRQHGFRHMDDIAPPVFLSAVFGPAGLRHQHLVGPRALRDDAALRVGDHPLGFIGADIKPKKIFHSI